MILSGSMQVMLGNTHKAKLKAVKKKLYAMAKTHYI
jgi:hypothetical protein